jgi:3-oxoacyl-[acyl-carrier protein] reductase
MDFGLRGKTAFIAGSTSGIGAAIARGLAQEGADVVIHGRDPERARKLAEDLSHLGGTCRAVTGRLDIHAEVDRIAEEVLALGKVDILVNSAGAASNPNRNWFEIPVADWMAQYQFVVLYAVRLIQAFSPGMRERKWGRILNISSGAALKPRAQLPDYAAAKSALDTLSVSLSAQLRDSGITVNTISPGFILTENSLANMKRRGFTEEGEALNRRILKEFVDIPIGRPGKVEDIAAAACFLVSEQAGFITGAHLRIDGGGAGVAAH